MAKKDSVFLSKDVTCKIYQQKTNDKIASLTKHMYKLIPSFVAFIITCAEVQHVLLHDMAQIMNIQDYIRINRKGK